MIVIACVDDNGGMMFNHRRQSSDRMLRQKVLELCSGKLWMNGYTARQFKDAPVDRLKIDDEFLSNAGQGEFCFAENDALLEYETKLEQIILFQWNRSYPADRYFDIPLQEPAWHCIRTEEFPGSSHGCITMSIFDRQR